MSWYLHKCSGVHQTVEYNLSLVMCVSTAICCQYCDVYTQIDDVATVCFAKEMLNKIHFSGWIWLKQPLWKRDGIKSENMNLAELKNLAKIDSWKMEQTFLWQGIRINDLFKFKILRFEKYIWYNICKARFFDVLISKHTNSMVK